MPTRETSSSCGRYSTSSSRALFEQWITTLDVEKSYLSDSVITTSKHVGSVLSVDRFDTDYSLLGRP